MDLEKHWDSIYKTKDISSASWYQTTPETSLRMIEDFKVKKSASIIDVGGGDGFLVDYLLDIGYTNITVLDISVTAIEKAKVRLGDLAKKVNWVVCDVTQFETEHQFDVWHDRAAFHFLNTEEQISNYIKAAEKSIKPNGNLIVGTFSVDGPSKCSGVDVKQYSELTLNDAFRASFKSKKCFRENHTTPSGSIQNFQFCSFKKVK